MKYPIKSRVRNLIKKFGYDLVNLQRTPQITEARLFTNYAEQAFLPRIIFDVGANIGNTARAFSHSFPEASIYSFEPITHTYNQLCENLSGKQNIHPEHIALSNTEEMRTISISPQEYSETNSVTTPAPHRNLANGSAQVVKLIKGDTYCRNKKIQNIDILKIDTEGHDLQVLYGFETMFDNGTIRFAIVEVGFFKDEKHTHFNEVHNFLINKGYILCGLFENHYTTSGSHNFGNALYIQETPVNIK